ncbi:M20/M25/M40 family metallo-hydrolase [Phytoactinopolyspora limicola]|uniref:M20/M25/M40 family metallo-hydrolase n=1 Tax=Phytoactinopolyspora limicola TaxID=2715536 RepID=UPI00140E2493|nr:M20/M25/M40 family metallo-hydrolase [Phytoactinopolyspora limicola]
MNHIPLSRRLLAGVGAVALIAATAPAATSASGGAAPAADSRGASDQAHDKIVTARIDADRIMGHIETLTVDIGPRVASSPEEDAAASYIADELESLGYDVEVQEFPYVNTVGYLHVGGPDGTALLVRAGGGSALTDGDGITAPVVDAGFGSPADFPAATAGAIALVQRGGNTFADIVGNAAEAGAVGVAIQNDDWRIFSATVADSPIPFVTMNDEQGELLRAAADDGATLRMNRYQTSQNVIATKAPTLPGRGARDEVVIFSAHYDSVPASPGASDNASGVAVMLELARINAQLPTATEIRFAAVGAEEVGLRGSRHYAQNLPAAERDRIIANFNMDMVGTASPEQNTLFMNTLNGTGVDDPADNLVSRAGRQAAERLGYGDIVRSPYHRGASDHQAFHEIGVPAVNFIWRDPVTAALEPTYHQPLDTIDRVSPDRLRTAAEIIAAASYRVIRHRVPGRPADGG